MQQHCVTVSRIVNWRIQDNRRIIYIVRADLFMAMQTDWSSTWHRYGDCRWCRRSWAHLLRTPLRAHSPLSLISGRRYNPVCVQRQSVLTLFNIRVIIIMVSTVHLTLIIVFDISHLQILVWLAQVGLVIISAMAFDIESLDGWTLYLSYLSAEATKGQCSLPDAILSYGCYIAICELCDVYGITRDYRKTGSYCLKLRRTKKLRSQSPRTVFSLITSRLTDTRARLCCIEGVNLCTSRSLMTRSFWLHRARPGRSSDTSITSSLSQETHAVAHPSPAKTTHLWWLSSLTNFTRWTRAALTSRIIFGHTLYIVSRKRETLLYCSPYLRQKLTDFEISSISTFSMKWLQSDH